MEGVDYLSDERNKAQFDVDAMKVAWAGSREAFEVSDRIAKLVANDPAFEKFSRPMLGRKELFKSTLRKAAHAWKLIIDLRLSEEEATLLRHYIDEPAYTDLQWEMFIPAIEGQGTEEQKRKWLPLARKMQVIGCYAQTELGHGSNVQGLETTATFDPQSDAFVINSPTLTSSKWWPGGMGKVSTHGIVYARLILDGQFHGVHGFIVQLRNLENHSPVPGITVGDIGLKFGNGAYNTMDNGVLRFDHVRIPRNQMLMRVSQVTKEGKFVQSDVPRQLIYGTMVYVRQKIVANAFKALSRAVCIATRYSAVRRQFGSRNGGPETQVIDYKTQQSRLFPLLASAYAFRFVSEWLKWLYTDVKQRLEANDFSTLPEAHACTAGLKSLTTAATADGIEECRKLCGGHGYLVSSGLPELLAVYVPACTYEGDNVVMMLQVARFLVKTVSELGYKQPVGTTAYMRRVAALMQSNCTVKTAEDWLNPGAIVEAFESRSARMAVACAQRLTMFENPEEGFAELSADLVEVSLAHCQLIVVSKFIEKLQQQIHGNGVKQSLEVLCYVYALFLLHKHRGDFLATGYLTPKQASLANDQLRILYSKVRPNAIALVDSFNHTDHLLSSILGRYDGNVYPKLYEAAFKDPFNDSDVADGVHQYVQPILKQELQAAKL
ncbi:peroxisomal acyl-coenzyme A oxidase 1-like isoform X1 [Cynara cardunculus var. scolymus]|uniref:peroxisomal acyl-coenzyme A oxidase 1-like isoform X1 n=1 Tax=Cynara cardunculus var. scolymus TaxID=59895 RepID=UPI000D625997|nr:peroxisomal acyl-coenzyme A oxidase 1-like isoform X1 [Cynara cardunculus var. scolymus]